MKPPLLIVLVLWPVTVSAFAHAEIGSVIEDIEMPAISGGSHHLLTNASANVLLFFRPGQEHSRATLKQLAVLERETAGQSVHWVAIVSDSVLRTDAEAAVKEAGLIMPVLVDVGDALYGKLGVALHPVIGVADKQHKLVAYLPFAKVNYAAVIRAHLRHLLKEITDEQLEQTLQPAATTPESDAVVARRRLVLATKLFEAKNYGAALASVKRSLEKDPALAAAHALLGQILAAQGRCREAVQAFAQALQLDPTNTAALEGKKACEKTSN